MTVLLPVTCERPNIRLSRRLSRSPRLLAQASRPFGTLPPPPSAVAGWERRLRRATAPLIVIFLLALGSVALGKSGDDGAAVLAGLPACPTFSGKAPGSWPVVTGPDDGIAVAAPRGFAKFDRGVVYMHGGTAWRSGTALLDISYGWWGQDSFPQRKDACQVVIDGMPTMYMEVQSAAGVRIEAWYVTDGQYDPVLAASSSRAEDLPTLRLIVRSVRKRPLHNGTKHAP